MTTRRKIIVVLFFVAVCAAAPVVNSRLRLHREEVTPADLYKVVYNQLNAFRAEDYSLAYSQASNGIQQKFNPDQFAAMIRRDYSELAQAERVEFGVVKYRGDRALVQVFFVQRDGSVLPSIYSLIYEGGKWKIEGARVLSRWPAGSQDDGIRV